MRRMKLAEEKEARLLITERVWSRIAERYFRKVEHSLEGVLKILEAKNILKKWVKTNVPLSEEN